MSDQRSDKLMTPSTDGHGEGRDARGRFGPGNRFGRGNPAAARAHALHLAFTRPVTEENAETLSLTLLNKALGGNLAAAKLWLTFALSRSAPALGTEDPSEGTPALWRRMCTAIDAALADSPDARRRIADAMAEIERTTPPGLSPGS